MSEFDNRIIIIKPSNIIRWSCGQVSFKLFNMKLNLSSDDKSSLLQSAHLQKSYCNCVSNENNCPVLISIDLQRLVRPFHPEKRRSLLGNQTKRSFSLIQACFTLILGGFEFDVRSLSAQSRYMIHYDAAVYNLHNNLQYCNAAALSENQQL